MNVAELIERLKAHDPGMPVVVAGYEGGYNDLSQVNPVRMISEVNREWYYGAHEEAGATGGQTVTRNGPVAVREKSYCCGGVNHRECRR
ncbi:hypothetical protein SIID45300_02127 [Candidatus Magnetaquicoccaceae bacterium FCR-1]|uniref:Uncharacterized protein n=1 Tax=Candidatus Magnetaquiglobus chichijimensis TaxID=3141448 RepID=A0ABQ0CA75_9PROT